MGIDTEAFQGVIFSITLRVYINIWSNGEIWKSNKKSTQTSNQKHKKNTKRHKILCENSFRKKLHKHMAQLYYINESLQIEWDNQDINTHSNTFLQFLDEIFKCIDKLLQESKNSKISLKKKRTTHGLDYFFLCLHFNSFGNEFPWKTKWAEAQN